MNLTAEIKGELETERYLDFPVTPYIPKSLGQKLEFGTAASLKHFYSENYVDGDCSVVMTDYRINTSPEALAILKALLYTGCCRIEERSIACRKLFTQICKTGNYIGREQILSVFEERPENPFQEVLQNAIKEILGDAND